MFQIFYSRSSFIIYFLLLLSQFAGAQFATGVTNYTPAPGQYTNAEFMGTPAAANSIVSTNKGMVSLGAFGGSVTVYFAQAIQNDPANPYGVDFTIYGNPTSTWSEPGIIQVMKDENKNGIPDDTWYEIAGSDHYWTSTQSNYEVTYQNSGLSTASDIHWTDNLGKSGIIPQNSFHQQSYYPTTGLFPAIANDKYTLKGTRLIGQIDMSNPGVVNSYRRAFGYADNTIVNSFTEKLPDNPYTPEIEGSGGDAIDISWAVDSDKKPVKLSEINFIRIYTGMNTLAGWLGEISTEITGIRDVEPANISGTQSMVVIQDLSPKIRIGKTIGLNALVFESGLRQNTAINWSVSNPELASISNGILTVKKTGTFQLRASSATNPGIYSEKTIEIFSVGKAVITLSSTSLKVNDKLALSGKITDQNGTILTGIPSSWRVDKTNIAELISVDGNYFLKGKQTGKCWLYLEATDPSLIHDSVQIEVFPESVRKKVYIAVKTSEKSIFPRQSVWVDQFDLTSKVDRALKTYGLQDIQFVSLAHALASVYKNTEFDKDWAFRDDTEGGTALYLWKLPVVEDGSTVYNFGYGGSRSSSAYRKTWVVMLNGTPYVNGFDKIKVNNDDEILVYHLVDNATPWTVTQLTSGKDTVKTSQPVEIQLRSYFCSMDNNRTVAINASEVYANQTVLVQQSDQANVSSLTDEFGKTVYLAQKSGNYLLTSGIDAAKLVVESITGNGIILAKSLKCTVFPNPFTESFTIDSELPIKLVNIYNLQGQKVFSQTEPKSVIVPEALNPGIYLLIVEAGNKLFQQKIIKN